MRKAELVSIETPYMPVAHLRMHQQIAVLRYAKKDEVALFFEMGCGKSLTLLSIAEEKFRNGEIDGLLVIAPNDVHRQWYDELVMQPRGHQMESIARYAHKDEVALFFEMGCGKSLTLIRIAERKIL